MASDFSHRVLYRKDERGVIVDSGVFGPDDEVPDGFEESVEYTPYIPSATEAPPVDESRLTTWDGLVLGQTVDVIKGDDQEGPSQPGGLDKDDVDFDEPDKVEQSDDEVTADDGSSEHDVSETIDEVKGDDQEGPSDPRGEQSADADELGDEADEKKSRSRNRGGK